LRLHARAAAGQRRGLDRQGGHRRAGRDGRHLPPAGPGAGRGRLRGRGLRLDLGARERSRRRGLRHDLRVGVTARTWITLVAAVVFGAASGALVGAALALPSDGVWAVSVGTELAGLVPLDPRLSVDALVRQVLGGTAAAALVGAALAAALVWTARALW